jgi:hypothetical protein
VLILQGQCGGFMAVHTENCARCHQINIDTTVNPALREVAADTTCAICNSAGDEAVMLVCDACNTGYHTHCLQLPGIPSTTLWVCPVCTTEGITADSLEKKLREAPGASAPEKDLFLTPNQRKEEEEASLTASS